MGSKLLLKGKTGTRTFSMRKDLVEALEKEAHSRGISTSALVNQVIERSVNVVWPNEKIGALIISREITLELLKAYSVNELERIGATSARDFIDTAIILMGTKRNLESVLETLDIKHGRGSRWFMFTRILNGRNNRVLLNHDMSIKWSIFLESYVKNFIIEMLDIPVKTSYTDTSVVLEFTSGN